MAEPNSLELQIAEARRSIFSDGYPMSVGEITNLYRDNELIIRPEFQRFFRWTSIQKSRLVESLLLGIPLPSIFVAQTETGKWELVDGLQRISTILQLQGELLNPHGGKIEPLILEATKYLPAMEGRVWYDEDPARSLTEAQRLDIKRSKIDIKIIKRESSPSTKYDLFQRLNNYGTPLTTQEIRSALLVSVSPEFFSWLESLASYPNFVEATQLGDRLIEERYDLEIVTRFLVLHNRPESKLTLTTLRDVPQVLDNASVEMAMNFPAGIAEQENVFKATFDHIAMHGGEDVFRRWDRKKNEFQGPFLNTAFEIFGLGIGYNIANRVPVRSDLMQMVKEFWFDQEKGYATGKATEWRLAKFMPLGRKITAMNPI
ncbi:DUF262 domain-containing protein [Azospirillum sp. Marseille-Q6669]